MNVALALLSLAGATSGFAAQSAKVPPKSAPAQKSAAAPKAAPKTGTAAKKAPAAKSTVAAKKPAPVKKRVVRRRVVVQNTPTRDRITEIQSALAGAGVYAGVPTGKWDAATTKAMMEFQSANGLAPTGKITALTLAKLGLGAETAGRGSPVARLPTAVAGGDSTTTP